MPSEKTTTPAASSQDANAIVRWAERQKSDTPTDTSKFARLDRADVSALIALHKAGKSQVEIAQSLGCTQSTVSKWLKELQPTIEPAKEYLAGQALRMAQNVVKRGMPRDHVAVLKGLNVLEEERSTGVTVLVGQGGLVNFGTLSPPKINDLA